MAEIRQTLAEQIAEGMSRFAKLSATGATPIVSSIEAEAIRRQTPSERQNLYTAATPSGGDRWASRESTVARTQSALAIRENTRALERNTAAAKQPAAQVKAAVAAVAGPAAAKAAEPKDAGKGFFGELMGRARDIGAAIAGAPGIKQIVGGATAAGKYVYGGLENRYGSTGAKSIAGLFALPMIGTPAALAGLAVAEGLKQGRKFFGSPATPTGAPAAPPPSRLTPAAPAGPAGPVPPRVPGGDGASLIARRGAAGARLTGIPGLNLPLGGMYAGALGGIHLAERGFSFAASTMNTSQRNDLTDWQKRNAIADSIPVIGGLISSIREFARALDGTTETMRRASLRHEEGLAADQARARVTRQVGQERALLVSAQAGVASTSAVGYAPLQAFDRQTLAGAQQYRDYQRLLPLQERSVQLERDAFVRAAEHSELTRQRAAREQDVERARHRTAQAEFRYQAMLRGDLASTPTSLQSAANEFQRATRNQAAQEDTYQSAFRRQREAAEASAHAQSAVRQGQIAQQREQLAIREERRERIQSNALRFGRMSPIERQLALAARERIDETGVDLADPLVRDFARRADPRGVERLEIEAGERSPEYQRYQQRYGLPDERQTLRGFDIQTRAQEAQVRVNVVFDQETVRRQIEESFRTWGRFIQSVQTQVNSVVRDIQAGRAVQNSNAQ